jgi:phasin
MASNSEFEIPEAVREMAEKGVEQARRAYDQFLEQSRKAQDMVTRSSAAMGASAKEIHAKALQYTEENMKSGFDLADKLSKAKSVREALELQAEYARHQMEIYTRQARELTAMMTKVGQDM